MLLRYFAGCCIVVLAATAAHAGLRPTTRDVRPAAAACSFGYHLDISGMCVDSMDYSRRCPPGFFAASFPNGNGFRCLPAEWLASPGWLGDLLWPRNYNALPR